MTDREEQLVAGSPAGDQSVVAVRRPLPSRSSIGWTLALLAMVAVTYLPVRYAGFVMDDDINLASNRTLYSLPGLVQLWLVPSSVDQYYPLVHTMFWIESRLWGFHPLGYHIVNVVLHALNVVLVWYLLRRLRVPGAWLGAALFAVHPVEVESVAWAVERKNVLSLACALGSILCYLRFSPPTADEPKRADAERWYTFSLILFAAALFSKTAVVTVPCVLLVLAWWQRGAITRKDLEAVVPFFLLGIFLGAITLWQETYHVGAQGNDFQLSPLDRVLVAGRAIWFYAGKLIWPQPVIFFYPRFVVDAGQAWQYAFPAAALAAPLALWLLRARLGRGPLAAVLIFIGVSMPTLGFFNVYFFLFSFVADHFQYHASVALIALAAATAVTVFQNLTARAGSALWWSAHVATAAVLMALGAMSFQTATLYRDEETLYRDAIAKNPGAWIAYSNLGVQFAVQGRYDEAEQALREALAIDATKPRVDLNYATVLLDRGKRDGFRPGDLEAALDHFQQATRLAADWSRPYVGMGQALAVAGRLDEAEQKLRQATELEPTAADAWAVLGEVQQQRGAWGESQASFEQAVRLNPGRAEIRFGLGRAYAHAGRGKPAAAEFTNAVELRPDYAAAWCELGIAAAEAGDFNRAVAAFRELQRLQPSAAAEANLAAALARQQGESAATDTFDWQRP